MNFAAAPATPAAPDPAPSAPAAAKAAAPPTAPAPAKPTVAPPVPPPAPPPPLEGSATDVGAVRHDTLRVLDWSVRGASKVLGDAAVGFARIHGVATVGGKLTATDLVAQGTLNVLGTTDVTHRVTVQGTARFSASVRAAELSGKGRTTLEGDLHATGPVELSGTSELSGDLDAGALTFRGTITTPGALRVNGDLHGTLEGGRSQVGSIVGQRIEIVRPRFPPWRTAGTLRTLRIEGTELRLEGVIAEFVKGDAIHVGAGCRLSRVEGTVVDRHKDAVVGPSAVSEDIPRGLWR